MTHAIVITKSTGRLLSIADDLVLPVEEQPKAYNLSEADLNEIRQKEHLWRRLITQLQTVPEAYIEGMVKALEERT